jgi:multimeric flavodoxin WrbA
MSHNGSDIAAARYGIAYHSGFGHTAVLADAVAAGAREAGADVSMIAVDQMTDADWDILDAADGIVFGSATYMGNVSAGFQTFAEKTGRRCLNGSWRDKVAAGFTNSGAKSGDKVNSLVSLAIFAAQHHMHWDQPGFGRGLEQRHRQRERPQPPRFLAGRGRADRRGRQSGPGAPLRCADLPPPRLAGRPGDTATQHRPIRYSSGFISCSIVGTNSLTVGWMCMVREIAV